MNISDEERNRILSPEEIAELDDDEYNPDEDNAAAIAEIGRGSLDDEDESDDDSVAAQKAEPKKEGVEVDEVGDAAAEKEPAKVEPAADDKMPDPAPTQKASGYKVDLPEDFDDKLRANKTARADLRKQFNDGQMDQAEYDAGLDNLDDQRDELSRLKTRAEIATEMRAQNEQNAWINTIHDFMGDAATKAELGIIDYKKDVDKQGDLDAFVKALAGNKANEDKPPRWFLEEAHKRVVALHSVPVTKKAPVDVRRKPDASAVVTNLAEVPGGAGDADPSSNEFAEIDKLQGLAYERAMAAMSTEKRELYLRSA